MLATEANRSPGPWSSEARKTPRPPSLVCQGSAGQAGALPIFSSSSCCYSNLEGPETMAPHEAGPQGGAADLTARRPPPLPAAASVQAGRRLTLEILLDI